MLLRAELKRADVKQLQVHRGVGEAGGRGGELVGFGALVCQNCIKQRGANEHLQYI